MKVKITGAELSEAVSNYLSAWDKELNEKISDAAREHTALIVRLTKMTAPVGKRQQHYRDSISMKRYKTTRTDKYIWYVKGADYRLSHLLENDHAKKNGGLVKGTHFIEIASEPVLEDYEKVVEEIIRNG